MKTKTILFLFLLISGIMSAQVKRVAILETVDRENKVSYGNKLILRANLSKAITNTAGYEAYDRTDIDAIMGEQNFQRTGLVSNDQIKKLGEMTGANYILVAEAAVVDANNMFITAKLLDVETARTIMTDNVMMAANPEAIQKGCVSLAKRLFHDNSISNEESSPTDISQNAQVIPLMNDILVKNSKSEQRLYHLKEFSYGNVQMDKKQLRYFLRNNSPDAYKSYKSGETLIKAGWWTLGSGLILSAATAPFLYYYPAFIIGIPATITSVSLICVGYAKKNQAIEIFNSQNNSHLNLSVNLGISNDGIGIALKF
ncbi:MAG: hypothetical protein IJX48_00545 [Paludibacteraceae bacterium]|nr:hypothetical protein [Paludibacteraceae bacterium]